MIIKKYPFIANARDSVSVRLKLAVLRQNIGENSSLRNQNISSTLDGIVGSNGVNNTLLEVSAKKGEAKTKKAARIFSAPPVLIVTKNLESLIANSST